MAKARKPVIWIGTTLEDLREFPEDVRRVMGQALDGAQTGAKHPAAKPLKGFGGASVLEMVDDYEGNTYRAVYTVRFAGVVYALHAFQKKSKRGIETPKHIVDTVRDHLKRAEEHHKEREAARSGQRKKRSK